MMKHLICTAIAAATLFLPQLAEARATDRDLVFKVYRAGSDIGRHKVSFERLEDGDLQAKVEINLRVGLGPITFYRYEHENTEIWRDGKLLSIRTETYNDGEKLKLDGTPVDDKFRVTAKEEHDYTLPVIPTSYWNKDILERDVLLNSQSGEPLPVEIRKVGDEDLTIDGLSVKAEHYRIEATNDFPFEVDIWYDSKTHRWVGMQFPAKGEMIKYELVSEAAK
ncbi:MAG: hypothetical protein Alpg2KO_05890 [Alphaproteobacteria bacterium]